MPFALPNVRLTTPGTDLVVPRTMPTGGMVHLIGGRWGDGMVEQRVERRLTAIFVGDVAGYSRLMGVDEEGTLSRLNAHRREFLDPKIADHHGRVVKRTGDGILIEFASAVDAARCAVEIQHGMIRRNAPVPQDKRIELRIGIHVGDIIIEEGCRERSP